MWTEIDIDKWRRFCEESRDANRRLGLGYTAMDEIVRLYLQGEITSDEAIDRLDRVKRMVHGRTRRPHVVERTGYHDGDGRPWVELRVAYD